MYLAGARFKIITDHKPLEFIFNNPSSKPPVRIERWCMYLQKFGKENPADYMCRHPVYTEAFALFGIPGECRTDNGPPFQGEEFAMYAKTQGFGHRKITPLHPEANGEEICENTPEVHCGHHSGRHSGSHRGHHSGSHGVDIEK